MPAPPHSDLPIINVDPPPRPARARYGSLLYLAIAGLVVLTALLTWFGLGVWSLRTVFENIYVLHDARRPEADRIQAAYRLAHDPRVTQRQYWDICLRKPLPDLARYLVAESLTREAMSADPRAYVLAVARSEGWPDWLRLLLLRPVAYGAGDETALPRPPLEELSRHADPMIALWASYTIAARWHDPDAAQALSRQAAAPGPERELAGLLRQALHAPDTERQELLDEATFWLRAHHPQAARVWSGWAERDGQLVRVETP